MADGITYAAPVAGQNTQNPLQNMQQMQAMGLRAAEMERTQQATEQQAMSFAGKQALGAIMQKHFNPENGEFDHVGAFGDLASHKELAPVLAEYMPTLLQMPGVQADSLDKQLNHQLHLTEANSRLSADAFNKLQVGGADPSAIATDLVAQQARIGYIDRKQLPAYTAQLVDLAKKNPKAFQQQLYSSAQFGKEAQESLQRTKSDLGYLREEVDTYGQDPNDFATYGKKITMPRFMAGTVSPILQNVLGEQQMPAQQDATLGGSAPPTGGVARQGESPSALPAGRLAEAPTSFTREQEAQKPESAWGKMRESIGEEADGAAASQQAITETRSLINDLQNLGKTGTGPTAKIRAQAVKLLNETQGLLDNLPEKSPLKKLAIPFFESASKAVAGSDDPSKWVGAAEALEKLGAITAIGGLRRAVGSGNKVTQQEVMKFIDIFPGLTSSPGGVKRMLDYMEKVNKSVLERQKFFNFFERENRGHRTKGFNPSVFDEEWNEILRKSGAIKFEQQGE
jgi:hypothetical protein